MGHDISGHGLQPIGEGAHRVFATMEQEGPAPDERASFMSSLIERIPQVLGGIGIGAAAGKSMGGNRGAIYGAIALGIIGATGVVVLAARAANDVLRSDDEATPLPDAPGPSATPTTMAPQMPSPEPTTEAPTPTPSPTPTATDAPPPTTEAPTPTPTPTTTPTPTATDAPTPTTEMPTPTTTVAPATIVAPTPRTTTTTTAPPVVSTPPLPNIPTEWESAPLAQFSFKLSDLAGGDQFATKPRASRLPGTRSDSPVLIRIGTSLNDAIRAAAPYAKSRSVLVEGVTSASSVAVLEARDGVFYITRLSVDDGAQEASPAIDGKVKKGFLSVGYSSVVTSLDIKGTTPGLRAVVGESGYRAIAADGSAGSYRKLP